MASKLPRILYVYRGKIERASKRGRISYDWHQGYSDDGTWPWMTRAECRADAKRRGSVAVFSHAAKRDSGWNQLQVKQFVKQVRFSTGNAWRFFTTEVREAFIAEKTLQVVLSQDHREAIDIPRVGALLREMRAEAGLTSYEGSK